MVIIPAWGGRAATFSPATDKWVFMKQVTYQGSTLDYLTLYPDDYEEGADYPLVICLHGYGADMHDLAGLAPALDPAVLGIVGAVAVGSQELDDGGGASGGSRPGRHGRPHREDLPRPHALDRS